MTACNLQKGVKKVKKLGIIVLQATAASWPLPSRNKYPVSGSHAAQFDCLLDGVS